MFLDILMLLLYMYGVLGRQEAYWVQFGGKGITSLLFADVMFLLASLGRELQLALEHFTAKCEAPGMRISIIKSEAMVLSLNRVECPTWVGSESAASSR